MDDEQERAGGGSLLVLALAAVAFALAQTAVVPGIGVLTKSLHTTAGDVSWVMSGYLVSAAILTPVIGRLGDMVGKRRMLIVSLAVFTGGSVVAALSPNVWVLVAARVIQGAGGGIYPLCFGIIGDTFPATRRPVALGVIAALAGIGAGGGLLMGGLLLDHATWQWVFWSGAIIAGAALAGTLRLPDSGVRSPGRIDVIGVLLLGAGLTAPLLALTRTSAWGWGDPRTLGLIAGGLVILAVFVLFELRTREPLIDMRVLGRPAVLVTNLAMLLSGFGMFGAFLLIPQLAETPKAVGYGFGLDATGSGLLLLPGCLAMLVAGGLSGRIGTRYGAKVPLVGGTLVATVGLAALAAAHGTQAQVIVVSTVVLAGIGFGMAAMPNLIIAAVPPEKTGESNGVNALVRSVGSSLGSQVVATLLAGSVTAASRVPTDAAYTEAFWLGAGGLLVAAAAGFLIPRLPAPVRRKEPVRAAA